MNSQYSRKSSEIIEKELVAISNATTQNVKETYIPGGLLEKIIENESHPAREDLIWQNGFFLQKPRKYVNHKQVFNAVNSPLTLHPEYLDELKKYVKILREEEKAFRAGITRRRNKASKAN